jgi:2-dehydropantoate 2-reductase
MITRLQYHTVTLFARSTPSVADEPVGRPGCRGTMSHVGYVVYGAGAIGGVVGGRLFQAGFDVTLIARGRHLDMLVARGMRIESPEEVATLRIPAVGHPRGVDWSIDQVVLMAVKSHQTAAALSELATVAPVGTPIVCLQNGIANEPAALRIFPNVHAVCVMCPAGHLEPGVVQAWSTPTTGLLDIGRFPHGSDQASRIISTDLGTATFSSTVVEDIRRWKNRKLLTNLGNAVEALCGPDERSSRLVGALVAEGEAALSAAGLETATRDEDRTRRSDLLRLGEIAGRPRQGGSSWQSVRRSTGDIETDYLNGEIVLLGRAYDVPTPANELIQNLARELASAHRAPGTIPVASILEQLEAHRRSAGTSSK